VPNFAPDTGLCERDTRKDSQVGERVRRVEQTEPVRDAVAVRQFTQRSGLSTVAEESSVVVSRPILRKNQRR
jgi:hypothetical protein